MSTQFRPLEIPAGVVAKPTKQMRSTAWSEVNLMRWRESEMEPVGGQTQFNYSFASRVKRVHGWYGLDGVYRIAYLCEANLYVDTGGVLTDISPDAAATNVNYGAGNYNTGLYSGTTEQPIKPPFFGVGGYGDNIYNFGTYGTSRAETDNAKIDQIPSAYSLDNFGGVLYAMTSSDRRLLMWDPAVGGLAIEQPETPGRGPVPQGRCFVVTNERYIMIFGTSGDGTVEGGKPNRFAWCDQENPGAWDYSSVTSMAGFLDIEPASPIICAHTTRNGVILFTAKKAYNSIYLGMPYIYNYTEIGSNCTPWSPQSITGTSALTVWMSKQGAFSFDGTSILPVNCLVRPWVDEDIDETHVREEACIVHVADFNEVWWFFPQYGLTKNSRCIIYSYKEGWWSQGRMSRTAGITSSYTAHTIMADDTVAYQHEAGNAYPTSVPLPWAETYDLNLNSGSRLTTLKQLIPDIDGDPRDLLYSLYYRTSRSSSVDANGNMIAAPEMQTAPQKVRPNGYVDFRVTARDIRLRVSVTGPLVNRITVGAHLIDAVPRGDR